MSDAVDLGGPDGPRTSSCATELVCRDCGYRTPLLDTAFKCPACGEGLDIDYDYERAKSLIAERGLADRPDNIWRFEELLPISSRDAQATGRPVLRPDAADPRRAARRRARPREPLPQGRLDQPADPLLQGPGGRAWRSRGCSSWARDEIGCVSTGNVGTAVAALAAKAGATAYIFYPGNMEKGKAKACRALGAQVCQLDGNYDQANRACRELSLASGIEFANITLRPFYAEGAKTMAFEVVEQLGWTAPDHFVIPAAGGTLSSRVHKGLNELEIVGLAETARDQDQHRPGQRLRADRDGDPRAAARSSRRRPTPRRTRSRSAPPATAPWCSTRCAPAAARRRPSPTRRSSPAIDLLGATEGILTEPAGGTTVAVTAKLAAEGKIGAEETVVAVISGNGLKTLQDHPEKQWPEMVACDVETMGALLADFRRRHGRRRAALTLAR